MTITYESERVPLQIASLLKENNDLLRENNAVHREHIFLERRLIRLTWAIVFLTSTLIIVALPPALESLSKYWPSIFHLSYTYGTGYNEKADSKTSTHNLKVP